MRIGLAYDRNMVRHHGHRYPPPPDPAELGIAAPRRAPGRVRSQLLAEYLGRTFPPCRVADIGGGKGLLAYLLAKAGWEATVVDPDHQRLPHKFKDLATGRQILIPPDAAVPHLSAPFTAEMAGDVDLLVGMHAHGCNIRIIDAAAQSGRAFCLLPCCVIDEPHKPPPALHWLRWLADYAEACGFSPTFFQLNFKGQNIGFYAGEVKANVGVLNTNDR